MYTKLLVEDKWVFYQNGYKSSSNKQKSLEVFIIGIISIYHSIIIVYCECNHSDLRYT